jgi:hypothetical protein
MMYAFPYGISRWSLHSEKKGINPDKILNEEQKNTERGVQTMFRTTSSNHFELSSLADRKANIMIAVNAIILSSFHNCNWQQGSPIYQDYIHSRQKDLTLATLPVSYQSLRFPVYPGLPINKGRIYRR